MGRILCTTHDLSDLVSTCLHVSRAVAGGHEPPRYQEVSIMFDPPRKRVDPVGESAVFFKTFLCGPCLALAEIPTCSPRVSEEFWYGRQEFFYANNVICCECLAAA